MAIYTRQQLALPDPKPNCLAKRTDPLQGITWHWTGTDGTLYRPSSFQRLHAIYDYHVNHLGYCDIAYNSAFDADGNIFALRGHEWVGAHAASPNNLANRTTLGIVFLEDRRGMTAAGLNAMNLLNYFFMIENRHWPQWWAHEYWARANGTPTACPGPYITQIVRAHGGHV